jgi:hypothetical protein
MNISPESSKPVIVCAIGLLMAFLMPWIQVFGVGVSGYSLARLWSYGNYAWVIPILAGATLLLSFSGINNRLVGAIAGIVPLGGILYVLAISHSQGPSPLQGPSVLQILSIGAWLTIIFSIAIIIAACSDTSAIQSQIKELRQKIVPSLKANERTMTAPWSGLTLPSDIRSIAMKDVFFFDKMLTPKIITFVYWLMLLGVAVVGLTTMLGSFLMGLVILIGGAIGARIWCELLIVLFKINDHARVIAGKTPPDPSAQPDRDETVDDAEGEYGV